MAQSVVITGGASGIGWVMAQRFAALGHQLAICDADAAAVAQAKQVLPQALIEQVDVRDQVAMDGFFDAIDHRFGAIDVAISNAGTGGPAGPMDQLDYHEWADCVSVNLHGAFLCCRNAARRMRAQGQGSIIVMSSTSGLWGVPNRSPYVAAKWGLIGLVKTLAMELGPQGIRVNAICPGAVAGPRMERVLAIESAAAGVSIDDIRATYTDGVSMKRFVTADEIADMAVFLASDAARSVSGQAIAVDGNTERMV